MSEKLHYSERWGFQDYAEVGKVYDIEVSGKLRYRGLLCVPNKNNDCTGCLFEATRLKYGIRSCPAFKNNNLLCVHTHDKDTRFIPIDSVLENL